MERGAAVSQPVRQTLLSGCWAHPFPNRPGGDKLKGRSRGGGGLLIPMTPTCNVWSRGNKVVALSLVSQAKRNRSRRPRTQAL
ncbi:hypothetical protein NQZ68_004367 [Dissostichus eleginoides]|nr:hypothetical protein NQZ68_004367 [Dissostichus eleginoides]